MKEPVRLAHKSAATDRSLQMFAPSWKKAYLAFLPLTSILYLGVLVLTLPRVIVSPRLFGVWLTCTLSVQVWVLLGSFGLSLFRTRVNEEGIAAFNFWGLPKSLSWREISAVQTFHFPRALGLSGIEYLRVSGRDSSLPLYLPLYLADSASFWDAVDRNAPLGNPVRQYMNLLGAAERQK